MHHLMRFSHQAFTNNASRAIKQALRDVSRYPRGGISERLITREDTSIGSIHGIGPADIRSKRYLPVLRSRIICFGILSMYAGVSFSGTHCAFQLRSWTARAIAPFHIEFHFSATCHGNMFQSIEIAQRARPAMPVSCAVASPRRHTCNNRRNRA